MSGRLTGSANIVSVGDEGTLELDFAWRDGALWATVQLGGLAPDVFDCEVEPARVAELFDRLAKADAPVRAGRRKLNFAAEIDGALIDGINDGEVAGRLVVDFVESVRPRRLDSAGGEIIGRTTITSSGGCIALMQVEITLEPSAGRLRARVVPTNRPNLGSAPFDAAVSAEAGAALIADLQVAEEASGAVMRTGEFTVSVDAALEGGRLSFRKVGGEAPDVVASFAETLRGGRPAEPQSKQRRPWWRRLFN